MRASPDDDGRSAVAGFVDAWTAGVAAGDAHALADLFDTETLFVGTAPAVLHGRDQVLGYFAQAPAGLRVQATVVRVTAPLPDLVHGVVDVVFTAPGVNLRGRVALSLVLRDPGWRVTQYQLAAVARPSG